MGGSYDRCQTCRIRTGGNYAMKLLSEDALNSAVHLEAPPPRAPPPPPGLRDLMPLPATRLSQTLTLRLLWWPTPNLPVPSPWPTQNRVALLGEMRFKIARQSRGGRGRRHRMGEGAPLQRLDQAPAPGLTTNRCAAASEGKSPEPAYLREPAP